MRFALAALLCTFASAADNSATTLGVPRVLALDPAGNIIVGGATTSFNLPVTNGTTNPATNFTVTTDHGLTWQSLGNLPSGIAFAFAIGPPAWPAVFATSSTGIFKSLDRGATWTAVTPVPGAAILTIDPTRPQVVYTATPAGIFKTTDAGATWTNIGAALVRPGAPPLYIVVDPFHPDTIYTHVVFADFRTFDGGKTWSAYTLPGVGNDASTAGPPAFDPLQPGVIYATGGRGIFRTSDSGQTWQQLNTPFTYGGPITVSSAAPGVIWVRTQTSEVYRSDDQGLTFHLLPAAPRNEFQFLIDPGNPKIILTGAHRSADGGATFQPLSLARSGTIQFDPGIPGRAIAASYPGYDGYLAKLDPTGARILFATYLGGFNGASVTALATDSIGNIYVTGNTLSSDFPVTPGVVQPTPPTAGGSSFAAKFDPTGALLYATYLPAATPTYTLAIAADTQGNIEIAARNLASSDPSNCFFVKLSADGSQLLANTVIAPMNCVAAAFDAAGNGAAVGYGTDNTFPITPDAFQPKRKGLRNAVLARFDPAGKLTYATYLGGSVNDAANAVAFDAEGSVYLTGTTKSQDFPVTAGAWQADFTAACPYPTDYVTVFGPGVQIPITDNQNSFLTKFDAAGAIVYSTYFGGNCKDTASAIAVDSGGNVWLTGNTISSTFPLVWPLNVSSPDSYKGFVTGFAASGAWLWRSSFLSALPSQALATDPAGNAYLGVAPGILKVTPQP